MFTTIKFLADRPGSRAWLLSLCWLITAAPSLAQEPGAVQIEWLTWSMFRIVSPEGRVILTNPWLTNPDSRTSLEDIDRVDVILVPTGHGDEVGQTVEIANQTGAKVVTTWEMAGGVFKGVIPDEQLVRTQPGSSVEIDGIKIRVVGAVHGSGGREEGYGGPALGFFITFENGYVLYFSGSTDVTLDMKLWGELFRPHGALLYYSQSIEPQTTAQMARLLSKRNPRFRTIIPHHQRLDPAPRNTPEALARALRDLGLTMDLINPIPGEIYSLTP